MTDKSLIPKDKDYQDLVKELQSILSKGLYSAYKAVDNLKVQTYWQIGERIVREELKFKDKAEYGKYLIDTLAIDLNIGRRLLYEIVQFHKAYPIVHTVRAQLSWSHYGLLIEIKDNQERDFYQNKSILHSWSVRELQRHIKSRLYQNASKQEIQETFKSKLPAITAPEVFKEDYHFHFVEVHSKEKELEALIIKNIEGFLKELGEDFSFLGRQVPIKISGDTHFIDLVLYHRGIPCVVLVELKVGRLDSRDIGQINEYVAYYRRNRQYEHERNAIGLIICQEADHDKITYVLDGLEEKIFIATYKAKLPSESQIKQAIKKLEI